jgi:hypothetical protein
LYDLVLFFLKEKRRCANWLRGCLVGEKFVENIRRAADSYRHTEPPGQGRAVVDVGKDDRPIVVPRARPAAEIVTRSLDGKAGQPRKPARRKLLQHRASLASVRLAQAQWRRRFPCRVTHLCVRHSAGTYCTLAATVQPLVGIDHIVAL